MNPFVNPKKRSVTLPKGCKNLSDTVAQPKGDSWDSCETVTTFVRRLLLNSQLCEATELKIGLPLKAGYTPIFSKEETGGTYALPPFENTLRPQIVAELEEMAKIQKEPFPKEGVIDETFQDVRLTWKVRIETVDSECVLTPVDDSNPS